MYNSKFFQNKRITILKSMPSISLKFFSCKTLCSFPYQSVYVTGAYNRYTYIKYVLHNIITAIHIFISKNFQISFLHNCGIARYFENEWKEQSSQSFQILSKLMINLLPLLKAEMCCKIFFLFFLPFFLSFEMYRSVRFNLYDFSFSQQRERIFCVPQSTGQCSFSTCVQKTKKREPKCHFMDTLFLICVCVCV